MHDLVGDRDAGAVGFMCRAGTWRLRIGGVGFVCRAETRGWSRHN